MARFDPSATPDLNTGTASRMADDAPNPEKPELRIGSYRLIDQLGAGGMSSVFRALHDESGHAVAVKVLPRSLAKNPTLLQRFLREAKTAEALEHPNIVAIFDRGVDQGRHYLVLEFVPGGDLHDRVRNEGPLSIPEAIRVVKEVAAGLSYAASLGLIHRDIKPANILVSPAGQVKIIDLGLALQAESEDERVTRDGTTVGTVDYMAPEQARDSRATSEKSDMYSLGCTLFYLLTGSAPFAGGNLADKLARHCTEPAPDPRKLRPDVPAALASLARRMMAKRPENRFGSYAELIGALDAAGGAGQGEVLDALIDDEDDDLLPEVPTPALTALVADDSEPELPVSGPARPRKAGAPAEPAPADVIPMAELAALEDDARPVARPRPARNEPPAPVEPALALLEEAHDEDVVPLHGRSARASAGFRDRSVQTLVKRYVAIGVAVVLLIIGTHKLYETARQKPDDSLPEAQPNGAPLGPTAPVGPAAPVRMGPAPPAVTVVKKAAKPAEEAPKPPPPWVEPTDAPPPTVPEPPLNPALEAQIVPGWARQPIPEHLGGVVVPARRIAAPGNAAEKTTLRLALDVIGNATTVELADNGPFCEDDLRIPGDARLIRARAGFRPVIKVQPPRLRITREQPAVIVLDAKQLILDGVDLVVDVEELPRNQTALFECVGAALTLRNCTITVVNARLHPFSLVRTARSVRPSRVRMERVYVRGPGLNAFEFGGENTEVVLGRSVLFTGRAPVFRDTAADSAAERTLSLVRTIVGSQGPLVDFDPPPGAARTKPIQVRALGCTFAAIAGGQPPTLLLARSGRAGASRPIAWSGDRNVFTGWSALYSHGEDSRDAIADLAAARRTWSGSDASSREQRTPWPVPRAFDRVVPAELGAYAPEPLQQATLTRVATPSAYLHEKTYFSFDRPPAVEIAPDVLMPEPAAPPSVRIPSAGVPPTSAQREPAAGPLVFDVAAAPWNGDLGAFLRERWEEAGPVVRVRVKGQGVHPCTPIRVPPGTSLYVLGAPENAPDEMPAWSPAAGGSSDAEALIDVRGGDLIVAGVNFVRPTAARAKVLLRVDRGHLVVYRCRLVSPGGAEAGDGRLLEFRATTTEPLAARVTPFATAPDRPTCRLVDSTLITGGDALAAVLGRGRVELTNCAVAAGVSAFVLGPAPVARARFEADLSLDRCTVAAERNAVLVEPWKGTEPGPDRPWLVTTRSTAFVGSFAAAARDHVLLRSLGDSVAHGTLFWQGSNDAFEYPHFTAAGDGPSSSKGQPDLQRQWLELWGANHFRNALGPGIGKVGAPAAVRFSDRLRPGEIRPRDLALEFRDRRAPELGADAKRLQLTVPTVRGERKY